MTEFIKKITSSDTRTILAITYMLGVLSYVGLLMVVEIPQANLSLIQQIVPMLISSFGVVLSFHFGSSKADTKKKDDDLKN